MSDFQTRKAERKEYFLKYVYGWKERKCGACAGSGYYDHSIRGRTPRCSACEGTGKEKYRPEEETKEEKEERLAEKLTRSQRKRGSKQ